MKRTLLFILVAALAFGGIAAAQVQTPFLIPREMAPDQGRSGGTVNIAVFASGGIRTFNPFIANDRTSSAIISSFLGAFLGVRYVDNVWRPYAAESWTISPDNRTITYRLRKGMRWSTGQPLTAEDYLTAWTIHANVDVGSNSYATTFVGDEQTRLVKVDDHTLRFELGATPSNIITKTAWLEPAPTWIFKPVYEQGGAKAVQAMWSVGTPPAQLPAVGPWVMRSFAQNERIEWVRNPNFDWVRLEAAPGDRLPYLEGFTQTLTANIDQSLALFLGGNAALFGPRNADDLRQITQARNQGTIAVEIIPNYGPSASSEFIILNFNALDPFKRNLFANARFRQAISHLINRPAIIETALGGLGRPAYGPVSPALTHFFQEFVTYPYNPERAAEILRGLGFTRRGPDGILIDAQRRRLEFGLITNTGSSTREATGRILVEEGHRVGVKVNFTTMAAGAMFDLLDAAARDAQGRAVERGFDAMISGLTGGDPDNPASKNVWTLGATLQDWNRPGTPDGPWAPFEVQLDRFSRLADQEPDFDRRKAIIDQWQRAVQENQPFIYTISPNAHLAYLTRVGGFYPRDKMNSVFGTYFVPGAGGLSAGINWFLRQ